MLDRTAHEQRVAWYRQARFGMFIHWGLYAIPARGDGIQPPMDKHAKPRLAVPRHALLMGCAVKHGDHSFLYALVIMTQFNTFVTYIAYPKLRGLSISASECLQENEEGGRGGTKDAILS